MSSLGWCKFYIGAVKDAIPSIERAIRLSPRDGQLANWYWRIGVVHLVQSRLDEVIRWFEKARNTYALEGQTEPAAAALLEARSLAGDNRYS
jgi:tetratricopeptide (TPR) repeat protein